MKSSPNFLLTHFDNAFIPCDATVTREQTNRGIGIEMRISEESQISETRVGRTQTYLGVITGNNLSPA
jgi:hypothetical protein